MTESTRYRRGPETDGRPALDPWQGIYLFEHRGGAHSRRVVAHLGA